MAQPISTITGRPVSTTEEEFSSRAGLLSGLSENIQMLERGRLGPEWELGVVSTPGIRKLIPESTQRLASKNRRMIYNELKKETQAIIKDPKEYAGFLEKVGIVENKAVKRGLQDYKEKIKALTSLPDDILARAKNIDPPLPGYKGTWAENLSRQKTLDKGGAISITPGEIGQPVTILHEGTHAAHGMLSKLYRAVKTNPEAKEIWETVPEKSKQVIKNISKIDDFHRKWYSEASSRRMGQIRYETFYEEWPAELLASEAPSIVKGLVSKLGRRLTIDEYLQGLKPVASRLQPQVKKLEKKLTRLDKEFMK
jgi:hypothetical protein